MENKIWTLLARQLAGEATPEESKELQEILVQDPVMAKMAQEMKDAWHDTDHREMQKALSSFSRIDAQIQKDKTNTLTENPEAPVIPLHTGFRKYRIAIVAVAAVVVLSLSVWFVFREGIKTNNTNRAIALHEIATLQKTIREITLPDGSIVHLNEGSKMSYNDEFNNKMREIWLTGEAFFDVTKNKEKPFIIHTGKVNVKVLGTAFNVRSYPDEQKIETSLVRGSVEVTINDDPSKKYMLVPNQKLIIPLVKNDTVHSAIAVPENKKIKYGNLFPVKDIYSKDSVIAELSWMEGKLAFYETSFRDLSARLAKRYNVSFVFEDKSKEGLEFTGVFYKQTLQQAMERLSIAEPFNYKIKDNTVYILK